MLEIKRGKGTLGTELSELREMWATVERFCAQPVRCIRCIANVQRIQRIPYIVFYARAAS